MGCEVNGPGEAQEAGMKRPQGLFGYMELTNASIFDKIFRRGRA